MSNNANGLSVVSQPVSVIADSALIDVKGVAATIQLSTSWVWNKVKHGDFPKPIHLSPRCTRWRTADVRAYIERKSGQLREAA